MVEEEGTVEHQRDEIQRERCSRMWWCTIVIPVLGDEVEGWPGLPSNTLSQNKNKEKAATKRYNRKTTTKLRKDLDTRLSMIDFFETIT